MFAGGPHHTTTTKSFGSRCKVRRPSFERGFAEAILPLALLACTEPRASKVAVGTGATGLTSLCPAQGSGAAGVSAFQSACTLAGEATCNGEFSVALSHFETLMGGG